MKTQPIRNKKTGAELIPVPVFSMRIFLVSKKINFNSVHDDIPTQTP